MMKISERLIFTSMAIPIVYGCTLYEGSELSFQFLLLSLKKDDHISRLVFIWNIYASLVCCLFGVLVGVFALGFVFVLCFQGNPISNLLTFL